MVVAPILRQLSRQARRILLTLLLGGLLGATLVRLGPGFDVDERELDTRLSAQSQQAIRTERARDNNIAGFYFRYLAGLVHGDFGFSRSLNRPVSELLKERLPADFGFARMRRAGWRFRRSGAGAAHGLVARSGRRRGAGRAQRTVPGGSSGGDRAGLLMDGRGQRAGPSRWWSSRMFTATPRINWWPPRKSPHVVAAQAKGLSSWRVLWAHIFTPAAPQLAALAGISVSLAFGASIPIEVICDTPGVGQLAWRAALDRDLPLLVTITVLVALMTLVVNSMADIALAAWKPSAAE